MSMIWGGKLKGKLSAYSSAIVKLNMANKYGELNYSTKAYPSPALTEEEWNIVFKAAQEKISYSYGTDYHLNMSTEEVYWTDELDAALVSEVQTKVKKMYYNRGWTYTSTQDNILFNSGYYLPDTSQKTKDSMKAMPKAVIEQIMSQMDSIQRIGSLETQIYDTEVIDRWEKCIVKDKSGFTISTQQQKENLFRYLSNDESSSYTIYYDAKTMLPLLSINDAGYIRGWDQINPFDEDKYDKDFDRLSDTDEFKLRLGTVYMKWTRTVKRINSNEDSSLGKTFVIDSDTFPGTYKIVGETYVRNQKTGKDERCQLVIHRAEIASDTNISLEAEGNPTVFSMQIEVLSPPNNILAELKQFEVDEDSIHGGTRVIPTKSKYSYTPTTIVEKESVDFNNNEIY